MPATTFVAAHDWQQTDGDDDVQDGSQGAEAGTWRGRNEFYRRRIFKEVRVALHSVENGP